MTNLGVYATYEEVKEYLDNRSQQDLNIDNTALKRFAVRASRRFDSLCFRKFYPTLETRTFDDPVQSASRAQGGRRVRVTVSAGDFGPLIIPPIASAIRPDVLKLDDDLLEVVTLTTSNGDITITAADRLLRTGNARNQTPYDRIVLKSDGTTTLFTFSGTPQDANSVTAFWGYHEDWANAWASMDTVQDDPLTSSETTVTVADADGEDENGLIPRFRAQQLIRFGTGTSAEYAFINAVNPEVNTLTVRRGVNGTTAAQQANATAIFVFRPMEDIVLAMLVLATYSYRRKDDIGRSSDRSLASSTGVLLLPARLPDDVTRTVETYTARSRGRS